MSERFFGNPVTVHVVAEDKPSGKKVVGVVANQNSSRHILHNATNILEDRLVVKARKGRALGFAGPQWLALFNDYRLADADTYRQAMGSCSLSHPFEKILLVSDDRSVVVLDEKSPPAF